MKHQTETVTRRGQVKNDGLLAAIRQVEQAERDRALVAILGATDASRYIRGIVHAPTQSELADLFRTEAK
jgi:hypothetical protein